MEEKDLEILEPVDGLVDAEHVSRYLGVGKITLRSWVLRKKKGEAPGIHDRFPDPRGVLGTSVVWRADAIVEFGKFYNARQAAIQAKKEGGSKKSDPEVKEATVTPIQDAAPSGGGAKGVKKGRLKTDATTAIQDPFTGPTGVVAG